MLYLIKNYELFINNIDKTGEIITLSDNSFWQIDTFGKLKTSLWLAIDKVIVISKNGKYFLKNLRANNSVVARFLK